MDDCGSLEEGEEVPSFHPAAAKQSSVDAKKVLSLERRLEALEQLAGSGVVEAGP